MCTGKVKASVLQLPRSQQQMKFIYLKVMASFPCRLMKINNYIYIILNTLNKSFGRLMKTNTKYFKQEFGEGSTFIYAIHYEF